MPQRNIWHNGDGNFGVFYFGLRERMRETNALQSQNKNDILMTPPSLLSLSHTRKQDAAGSYVCIEHVI
jgi:hypothetical protein